MKILIQLLAIFLFCSSVFANTTVDENFDDQNITSPLNIYQPGGYCTTGCNYSTEVPRGGTGYSVKGDHASADELRLGYSDLEIHLDEGVYFRYYVYYAPNYVWPWNISYANQNVKIFKFAGDIGWDIELLWRHNTVAAYSAATGPDSVYLYWSREGGGSGHTTQVYFTAGEEAAAANGNWIKVEFYIRIAADPANNVVHVQINDKDMAYANGTSTTPIFDPAQPAALYTGTQQFASIRATLDGDPPAGEGYYYFDDVTIIHNEGDLCDAEPGDDPTPVDGACGTADGGSFSTAPSTNLCSVGTASEVSCVGSSCTWTCGGSNGGSSDPCSATLLSSGITWLTSGGTVITDPGTGRAIGPPQ